MLERNFFGPGAIFHHVGLAVRSIRELIPDAEPVHEPAQKVFLTFLSFHGITLELLEPAADDSPVAGSVQGGPRLVHLCFEVPDLEAAVQHCRPSGFHRISTPQPAEVFGDRRIVWVFSKQYGLFELVEAAETGSGGGSS